MPKILVVDDSKMDRLLIGGLLEAEADFEVVYANDGREALAVVEAESPDLVITDLVMPELDGLELVAHMKQRFAGIPTVLVTSQGNEETAVKALQGGAASYVPKAALATDLIETVETVLDAARDERSRFEILSSLITSEYRWQLPNDRSLFGPLIQYLQENLTGFGLCDETERTRLGVALEEALVNAAEHGNLELDSALRQEDRGEYLRIMRERLAHSPYKDRGVYLDATLSREEARFLIRDEGTGFDPDDLPDPTNPENLLKASGRGVMLMRTFMDEVIFNEIGNEVTLVKRRSSS